MWLVIDTAGPVCAAALFDADELVRERADDIGRGHAERLMPMVEAVMADTAWNAITDIAVTRGPGSFTGLRVGLSAARGFGLALGVPVYGVSVLDALAHENGGKEPFTLVLKAGRGEVWCAAYERTALPVGEPWNVAEDAVQPPAGFETIVRPQSGSASLAAILAVARRQAETPPSALYLRAPDAKPQVSPLHAARA